MHERRVGDKLEAEDDSEQVWPRSEDCGAESAFPVGGEWVFSRILTRRGFGAAMERGMVCWSL